MTAKPRPALSYRQLWLETRFGLSILCRRFNIDEHEATKAIFDAGGFLTSLTPGERGIDVAERFFRALRQGRFDRSRSHKLRSPTLEEVLRRAMKRINDEAAG